MLGMILGVFLSIQAASVVKEQQVCDVGIPSWSLVPFLSRVIYWKYVERLVVDVTPALSPDRAERDIFWDIFTYVVNFLPIQTVFVFREHFVL